MEFTQKHYERIQHVLPRHRGNVVIDNFTFLCAVFYILENGCQWRRLPEHFGKWHTIYVRFQRWSENGVWQRLNETLLAERLIVPCTADHASLHGVYNVFYRVFGINEIPGRITDGDVATFHTRVLESGVQLPKILAFILNKSRSHNSDASAAYKAHVKEIERIIASLNEKYEDKFVPAEGGYCLNVKDGNTLSAVLNYTGLAPSELQHKKYTIYETNTQVNEDQKQTFLDDIHNIVRFL